MKKVTVFALIGVLVLSLAGAVAFAGPKADVRPGGFCPPVGTDGKQITLTDEQKAQFDTWHKERMEHQKQVLKKEVEWGWITQEQADKRIDAMEQRQKDNKMGMGMRGFGHPDKGLGRDHGQEPGKGMRPQNGDCPNFAPNGQQITLTDEQKAQITAWHQERIEHQKQVMKKEVEWGWITQEQADKRIAAMEQRQKDGKMGIGMMGRGQHDRGHGKGPGCGMGPKSGECPNATPAQQ